MRHSRVRIGSGTSKKAEAASIAASAVSCIHSTSASVPRSLRAGSAFKRSTASATVTPGP